MMRELAVAAVWPGEGRVILRKRPPGAVQPRPGANLPGQVTAPRDSDQGGRAAALLRAIALQDRTAFAQLFAQYAPRIKGMLMGRGVAAGVAEDLTQDVMLTIWRKARLFDVSRGDASAWIFAITRNCLVNHLRGHRYAVVDPDDPALASVGAGGHHPEQALAAAQQARAVDGALQTLPDEQRAVLRAAYFGDQTLREVASEQHLPLGTVKTRARLALRRMRQLLKREGQ